VWALMRDDGKVLLEGALWYLPGRVNPVSGNGGQEGNSPSRTRTYDHSINRSSVQGDSLAVQSEASRGLDGKIGRTDTDLEGSTSPDVSKSCQAAPGTRLREVRIGDGILVRLNDTQLEARSAGGTWQPLTLSRIQRWNRTALADLLAQPVEPVPAAKHAGSCRIFSGGICTCRTAGGPS
jgi:hypothetical protein